MSDADKMGKHERDVYLARIDAERFGRKTDLGKHALTTVGRIVAWCCVAWGAVSIAKCKPESINALATLAEAFKKSGNNFGLLGIFTLLLLALAVLTLLVLYSMERHQKTRALERLGFYQRSYEALLSKGNTSSGINPDGSTPEREG